MRWFIPKSLRRKIEREKAVLNAVNAYGKGFIDGAQSPNDAIFQRIADYAQLHQLTIAPMPKGVIKSSANKWLGAQLVSLSIVARHHDIDLMQCAHDAYANMNCKI